MAAIIKLQPDKVESCIFLTDRNVYKWQVIDSYNSGKGIVAHYCQFILAKFLKPIFFRFQKYEIHVLIIIFSPVRKYFCLFIKPIHSIRWYDFFLSGMMARNQR